MKILITGFTGFVSTHFLNMLNSIEPGSTVMGIDRHAPEYPLSVYDKLDISFHQTDLLDKEAVSNILLAFRPEYILHLASVSSVALSWKAPADSFVNNTNIFLNLAEQVRVNAIPCRILSVGSSEEYGAITGFAPLKETDPLVPLNPYAVARVAQEMLSKIYADGFGQEIIMSRSFNHIGPGQKGHFVTASFAKQLVALSKNKTAGNRILAGDLSVIRDFTDVRDVVKAYYLLLKKGQPGEVYNICSGKGTELRTMLLNMSTLLNLEIEIETDPARIRQNEIRSIIGSAEKIKKATGWIPEITLEQSLADIIAYWQGKS